MADIRMEKLSIEEKPAILWGEAAEKVFLYIHGKSGCKEEAEHWFHTKEQLDVPRRWVEGKV